jgi:hypothetical protein
MKLTFKPNFAIERVALQHQILDILAQRLAILTVFFWVVFVGYVDATTDWP